MKLMKTPRYVGPGMYLLALSIVAIFHSSAHTTVRAATQETKPVLVELFTSEGCSSCPPADALLARLDATQFVAGARAIVLSEHVTYWDRQGWRDPFSLDGMTRRQNEYGQRFNLDDVYTPQVVVDGSAQFVGSDERQLRARIAKATDAPKVGLQIVEIQAAPGSVQFKVQLASGATAPRSHLIAALAEDAVQSSVSRGENAGRTLKHVAIVRDMQDFGEKALAGQTLTLKLPGSTAKEDARSQHPLRIVVFFSETQTGRVLGIDEHTVSLP